MSNPLINAKIKKTNKAIVVYKRSLGGYVDYNDCKTVYEKNELIFI